LVDDTKRYIPKESRNYIRKIVALALIGSDEKYLLKSEYEYLLNRANAYSIANVKLTGGESLKRVAKMIGLSLQNLKKLNRHLKYDFVPPYKGGYEIYIPYIKLTEFKQKYTPQPIKKIYKVHVVTKRDNLSYIGKKYGVSYKVIKDFNNLKTTRLYIKQKLVIPIPKRSTIKKIDSRDYYIVKKGDSLESIAKAHRVSVHNLRTQNNLHGSLIRVGERLKIYE